MSRGSARAPRRTGSSPAGTKRRKNPRVSQLDDATLKPTERLASTEEWSKLAVTWNNGFGGCTSLAHPGTVYCIQLFPVHQQYIIMVCYDMRENEIIYWWHIVNINLIIDPPHSPTKKKWQIKICRDPRILVVTVPGWGVDPIHEDWWNSFSRTINTKFFSGNFRELHSGLSWHHEFITSIKTIYSLNWKHLWIILRDIRATFLIDSCDRTTFWVGFFLSALCPCTPKLHTLPACLLPRRPFASAFATKIAR